MTFQKYNGVTDEVAHKILDIFPIGTKIESTVGQGGGTEVFVGRGMDIQPFSYVDDYNPAHYRKVVEIDDE